MTQQSSTTVALFPEHFFLIEHFENKWLTFVFAGHIQQCHSGRIQVDLHRAGTGGERRRLITDAAAADAGTTDGQQIQLAVGVVVLVLLNILDGLVEQTLRLLVGQLKCCGHIHVHMLLLLLLLLIIVLLVTWTRIGVMLVLSMLMFGLLLLAMISMLLDVLLAVGIQAHAAARRTAIMFSDQSVVAMLVQVLMLDGRRVGFVVANDTGQIDNLAVGGR